MVETRAMRQLRLSLISMVLVVAAGCDRVPGNIRARAEEPPPAVTECPAAAGLFQANIIPELLPDEQTLEKWQRDMVEPGPRFTGSPSLKAWHDYMAKELESYGIAVEREPLPIDWWDHQRWSLHLVENGVETGIPVASYYPYSGRTEEGGVTAALTDAGTGLPPQMLLSDLAGKIAYMEADQIPTNLTLFYSGATYVHDPDLTMTPLQDYTRKSLSFLTVPQLLTDPVGTLYYAKQGGAVGAIISLQGSPENVAGQYTPFMEHPGSTHDVPTLYVDRATGAGIKAAIGRGAQARLELIAEEHLGDSTDYIIGTLPGVNDDEYILVNTHTDGTSANEENGGLGVMAMARYFSSLPLECRPRTMKFVLTPGHFHSGVGGDTGGFIEKHPEIIAKSVASMTPEHLGQMEWLDDAQGYHPTGQVEPSIFFGSTAPAIQLILTNAVMAEDLRRTFVARPIAGAIYFGVGSPLHGAGVPNGGYITGPESMLSWANDQHVDQINYQRMSNEMRVFARVVTAMQGTSTQLLCAGMQPSSSGKATGCFPFLP